MNRINMKFFVPIFLILSIAVHSKTLDQVALQYFKVSEYRRLVLHPEGNYIAAETYNNSKEHLEIIDISKKKTYVVFNGTSGVNVSISDVQWIDNTSLIIELKRINNPLKKSIYKVIHLDFSSGVEVVSTFEFEKRGFIINNLPKQKNIIYFAHILHSKRNTSGAYRLNLKDKASTLFDFQYKNKIAAKIRKPFYWLTDSQNQIKVILSEEKDWVYYWLKNKHGKWIKTASVKEDSEQFDYPLSIDENNHFISIKRLENKDRKGVYLIDFKTLKVIKELYYSDSFDVINAIINPANSRLSLVRYITKGVTNELALNENFKQATQLIQDNYPKYNFFHLSNDNDSNKHLYLIQNFENSGIYVSVDSKNKTAEKIIEKASWQNELDKGTLKTINYVNNDGLNIEAYLSLPSNKKITALLVMPHGGPIGARSYGFFDSLTHFLSAYGVAVLKVNYRGSSGYGKKFEDAGNKQWGLKIEKDINDVVSHVIDKFSLNPDKICAAGTSYGGYSALMLHINYPKRYKCIISNAGPTDLPLMFTSSDWNVNTEAIKSMIEIVGDPHHDISRLKAQSPVYNAKKIKAPVLLFHGSEDPRVNVEHSIRMEYILKKFNKAVELFIINGEKHGFALLKNQIFHAVELLKFLNKSLNLDLLLEADEKTASASSTTTSP